jgi:ppGpp synthetase/RelA/SpoT-type nucleotidyltranferase
LAAAEEKWVREYEKIRPLYEQFTKKVRTLIEYLLEREAIGYHLIEARTKSLESFTEKIRERAHGQKLENPLHQTTDLSGIRIVVYYSDDVDKVARLVEREFAIDEENSADRGALLKPEEFGYRSVHYVISLSEKRRGLSEWCDFSNLKAEIQIRTVLQHAWAAIDHALRYKKDTDVPLQVRRRLFRLSGLLELADAEFFAIRGELSVIRNESRMRIAAKDTALEMNALTLSEYLKSSKQVALLVAAATESGITIREEDPKPLSKLVTMCIDAGFRKISELEAFLDEIIGHAPDYFKKTVRGAWYATPSFVVMYMLVAALQNIYTDSYLAGSGWDSRIVRTIRENASTLKRTAK